MKRTAQKISAGIEHLPILVLLFAILSTFPFWSKHDLAYANQEPTQASEPKGPAAEKTDETYHTPLAGEPLHLEFKERGRCF